jgi:hypothetical protein
MSSICHSIHLLVNSLPEFHFPCDRRELPKNGIYFLFEKGECAHGGKRIVRVGTHTGDGQLASRLYEHFLIPNKDRSIFRKNIGRAILNRDNDPYLELWELDLTSKENREKYLAYVNPRKQKRVEVQVSEYIQNHFSFAVCRIDDKESRLRFECALLSTIASCRDCHPSTGWFGQNSPKEKIQRSGLWNVQGLGNKPLSTDEFEDLSSLCECGGG